MTKYILLNLFLFCTFSSFAQNENHHEELGAVNWLRDYDKAIQQSVTTGKPVFILFQEVPGCSTCRNYGNNVLSHPLIVEAIETAFVPLAIFNNHKGADAKILQQFKEPSWNNPVVRVVNTKAQDVSPRLSGNYARLGVVETMITALESTDQIVPTYLRLLDQEFRAAKYGTETATVAMACFWSGEGALGVLDGVVETEAGWQKGKEVVRLVYNPATISFDEIIEKGKKDNIFYHVFPETEQQKNTASKAFGQQAISEGGAFRLDKDPKYYLSRTHYRYVPMTETQAARANSLIGQRQSPDTVLSKRQIAFAKTIAADKNGAWKDAIGVELETAWKAVTAINP